VFKSSKSKYVGHEVVKSWSIGVH